MLLPRLLLALACGAHLPLVVVKAGGHGDAATAAAHHHQPSPPSHGATATAAPYGASHGGAAASHHAFGADEANTLFVMVVVLIALSVLFELGKEALENHAHPMKEIVDALFGELTVLGFIGLLTFLTVRTGWSSTDLPLCCDDMWDTNGCCWCFPCVLASCVSVTQGWVMRCRRCCLGGPAIPPLAISLP
jgi:hypothetical protein